MLSLLQEDQIKHPFLSFIVTIHGHSFSRDRPFACGIGHRYAALSIL